MNNNVIKIVQSSFGRGQVDDLVFARNDLPLQAETSATLKNFMVLQQGGIQKRPGTSLLAQLNIPAIGTGGLLYYFEWETTSGNYLVYQTYVNGQAGILWIFSFGSLNNFNLGNNLKDIQSHAINGDSFIVTPGNTQGAIVFSITEPDTFSSKPLFSNNYTPFDPYMNLPASPIVSNPNSYYVIFGYPPNTDPQNTPFAEGNSVVQFIADSSYSVISTNFSTSDWIFAAGYNMYVEGSNSNYPVNNVRILAGSAVRNNMITIVTHIAGQSVNIFGFAVPISQVSYGFRIPINSFEYCAFYQNRLWLSYNNVFLASRVNSPYDFQFFAGDDACALTYNIPSDGSQITGMYGNDTMYIFSNKGVYAFINSQNQTITLANFNFRKVCTNIKYPTNIPLFYRHSLFFTEYSGQCIGLAYDWYGRAMTQNVNVLVPSIQPFGNYHLFQVNDNHMLCSVTPEGYLAVLQFIPDINAVGSQQMFMPTINQMSWVQWEVENYAIIAAISIANQQLYLILENGMLLKLSTVITVDMLRTGDNTIQTPYLGVDVSFQVIDPVSNLPMYVTHAPDNPTDVPQYFGTNSSYGLTINCEFESRPYAMRLQNGSDTLYSERKLTDLTVYYYQTLLPFTIVKPNGSSHVLDMPSWTASNQIAYPRSGISRDRDIASSWDYASNIRILHNNWGSATILGVTVGLSGDML